MQQVLDSVLTFISTSGFAMISFPQIFMIVISFVLMYLAINKKFEPLLLLPIAFGVLLANLPGADVIHNELFVGTGEAGFVFNVQTVAEKGGLLDMLYLGIKLGIYPPLIFLGIGAMTDFAPLIANPKSLMLGAAAQMGIFVAILLAATLNTFNILEAMSIGIIGGADGPTAILVAKTLAPHLLPAIAIAAYSYMALIPIIQPPIMRALTTKKERAVVMTQLRSVSKAERIIFPIMITVVVALFVPSAVSLVGMLMLGNIARECGVVERISKTAQNELINIITIFLGISVGATASAETFLSVQTLLIIGLGLVAFCFGTVGGILLGKIMCRMSGWTVNPLIGSAGVSAVPMAARVSQQVAHEENPENFVLMHAMGPNVAGVIGSAVAAGVFLSMARII